MFTCNSAESHQNRKVYPACIIQIAPDDPLDMFYFIFGKRGRHVSGGLVAVSWSHNVLVGGYVGNVVVVLACHACIFGAV